MTHGSHFEFLRLLDSHAVPFVVIGGHAVVFHGHVRATQDVDVIWLRSADTERAMLGALRAAHAKWISDEIDPATGMERLIDVSEAYIAATRLMMLVTDHGFVDLFDYVPGYPDTDVREVLQRSVESDGIRYVDRDWLRKMKQASGRPQDRADLERLG